MTEFTAAYTLQPPVFGVSFLHRKSICDPMKMKNRMPTTATTIPERMPVFQLMASFMRLSSGAFPLEGGEPSHGVLEHRPRDLLRPWHHDAGKHVLELETDGIDAPNRNEIRKEVVDVVLEKAQAIGCLQDIPIRRSAILVLGHKFSHLGDQRRIRV